MLVATATRRATSITASMVMAGRAAARGCDVTAAAAKGCCRLSCTPTAGLSAETAQQAAMVAYMLSCEQRTKSLYYCSSMLMVVCDGWCEALCVQVVQLCWSQYTTCIQISHFHKHNKAPTMSVSECVHCCCCCVHVTHKWSPLIYSTNLQVKRGG